MAKWTLENGRRIFKDGKFAFRVDHSYKGASCLSHSEADKLAHHITRLLNADENHPIIDENATCALINEDDPIVCLRCGLSEGEGTCPLEDIALDMAYRSRQKRPAGNPIVGDDVAVEVAQEIARNFDLRTHQIETVGKNVHMFFRKPCTVDLDQLPKERGGFTFHYELSEPLVIPEESPPNG